MLDAAAQARIAAYEELWSRQDMSFRRMAEMLRNSTLAKAPSRKDPQVFLKRALELIQRAGHEESFDAIGRESPDWPQRLADAEDPIGMLYVRGDPGLLARRSVAVIGSRKASREGVQRAHRIARGLAERGFAVTSGLAAGIDSAAHQGAIDAGGSTVAVLGTSICSVYPHWNKPLHDVIAKDHLLVSQIPVCRYAERRPGDARMFFPERNATTSALSLGSVVVEAQDRSGTLIQVRQAFAQGRKVFVLDANFRNPSLSWPQEALLKGAVRVRDWPDIEKHLS